MNYHPMTYVDDMWALLRDAGVDRVIAIGTSLGGLVLMLMAGSSSINVYCSSFIPAALITSRQRSVSF